MDESETTARLALHRITAGAASHEQLIAHFGSAVAVFQASRSQLANTPSVTDTLASDILAGAGASGVEQDLA